MCGRSDAEYRCFPTRAEGLAYLGWSQQQIEAGRVESERRHETSIRQHEAPGALPEYRDVNESNDKLTSRARSPHKSDDERTITDDERKSVDPAPQSLEPVPKRPRKKPSQALEKPEYDEARFEAGTGPLPPGAIDGFDPNIYLDPQDGQVKYKSTEQRKTITSHTQTDSSEPIRIYTDGSALSNGKAGACGGVGVWFGPADVR